MRGSVAAITLKNIPEPLYRQLKASAVRHHRSLNREAIYRLEQALEQVPAEPTTDALLDGIRRVRSGAASVYLTDADLAGAIDAGRP